MTAIKMSAYRIGISLSLFVLLVVWGCGPSILPRTDIGRSDYSLADFINDYRVQNGLEKVPISAKLTVVAETHARDLVNFYDPKKGKCNLHSWSENGDWTSCCYAFGEDHAYCMWDKPKEITGFPGNGYEIAAVAKNDTMTPDLALILWQGSPGHHDVIVNSGIWSDREWKAMGAVIYGGYAIVWFSDVADPDYGPQKGSGVLSPKDSRIEIRPKKQDSFELRPEERTPGRVIKAGAGSIELIPLR